MLVYVYFMVFDSTQDAVYGNNIIKTYNIIKT